MTDGRDALLERTRLHLDPGKVAMFERYGIEAAMGRREGIRFHVGFPAALGVPLTAVRCRIPPA